MIILKPEQINSLKKEIGKTNLFGIGEVHGVANNAELYLKVFEELDLEAIALEYPVDCIDDLMKFVEIGEYPKHWFFQEINDGRFNYEMLSVLKKLFNKDKLQKIICYDKRKNTTSWNEREQDYANAFIEQYDPSFKTLIIGGNYHLKTKPFKFDEKEGSLYPMCYFLKEKYGAFPIAEIIYTNGEFYNFEKQFFKKLSTTYDEDIIKISDYEYKFVIRDAKAIRLSRPSSL